MKKKQKARILSAHAVHAAVEGQRGKFNEDEMTAWMIHTIIKHRSYGKQVVMERGERMVFVAGSLSKQAAAFVKLIKQIS